VGGEHSYKNHRSRRQSYAQRVINEIGKILFQMGMSVENEIIAQATPF
jgi:hypothetical protein